MNKLGQETFHSPNVQKALFGHLGSETFPDPIYSLFHGILNVLPAHLII